MKPETLLTLGAAPKRGTQRGFTLIELLVTISIVAILAALAMPSFSGIALSSKLNAISSSFMASAHLARSEAIKRNAVVTLCASSDGATCTGSWKDGWIVLAGGTAIQKQSAFPQGFLMTGNVTSIAFRPTGVGATFASLTLCRATPTVGDQQRTVSVSATGRADVAKVSGATTCP